LGKAYTYLRMSKPDLDVALSDRISSNARRGGGGGGGGGRRGGSNRGRSGPARRERTSRPTPYSRGSRGPTSRSSSSASLGATTISISNLLPSVDEGDLKEIFGTMGTITRAVVHYERNGRSQGTAEVTFARSQDAEQAVKEYDAAEVDGRPMYLKMIVSRAAVSALQRPSSGSGASDQRCFTCNRRGHLAAECNSAGGRDRGRSNGNTSCYECGETGHIARQCPKRQDGKGEDAKEGECFVCKKTGHWARNCPDAPAGSRPGRRRDDKAAPKAEELDAEMEDYFKKKSAEESHPVADAPAPAEPVVSAA